LRILLSIRSFKQYRGVLLKLETLDICPAMPNPQNSDEKRARGDFMMIQISNQEMWRWAYAQRPYL